MGQDERGQMLAHCNVAYEMTHDNQHPKPNALVKLLLRLFVKNTVVGPSPTPATAARPRLS